MPSKVLLTNAAAGSGFPRHIPNIEEGSRFPIARTEADGCGVGVDELKPQPREALGANFGGKQRETIVNREGKHIVKHIVKPPKSGLINNYIVRHTRRSPDKYASIRYRETQSQVPKG